MKDKTFEESGTSQWAAGFLLSQTLLLSIHHHTLHFPLFPEQGCCIERQLCCCLSSALLFTGSNVILGSHVALPSPLFPLSPFSTCTNIPSGRKLCLHLALLLHKRNPLCLPCRFLAEQIQTLAGATVGLGVYQQNLEADPGLLHLSWLPRTS